MWHLESTDFYDKINPFQSIPFRLFHPIHVFTDANMHVRMCVCAQTHIFTILWLNPSPPSGPWLPTQRHLHMSTIDVQSFCIHNKLEMEST